MRMIFLNIGFEYLNTNVNCVTQTMRIQIRKSQDMFKRDFKAVKKSSEYQTSTLSHSK